MAVELTFADDSFKIPDHVAVDTYVTHIRIKDPDYADFIENIELDYDNQYFYFDTKLSKCTTKRSPCITNCILCIIHSTY